MDKKFKKGDKLSIRDKQRIRLSISKKFIKKYNSPVLVHSTPNLSNFKKILGDDMLKIPKNNKIKEHLYIEKNLNLYPSIFLSLGFQYYSSYNFKYGLIFSLKLLRKTQYYRKSLGFQCYREAFRFWEKNNPEYIEELKKKSRKCREVIDTYYNYKFKGGKQKIFEFWKIEKYLIELIEKYPDKRSLLKIFEKIKKEHLVKYPYSVRKAKLDFDKNYAPEIISLKNLPLSKNNDFLGFHIGSPLTNRLKAHLKKKYSGKIIFDGEKIKDIRQS